jgi:cytochrome c-type biogenesis protein
MTKEGEFIQMNYNWFHQLSNYLFIVTDPLWELFYSTDSIFVAVFLLGVLASLAPSQLMVNLAVSFYTFNQMTRGQKWEGRLIFFLLGKILAYLVLGSFIYFGKRDWVDDFDLFNLFIGPFFLFTGFIFVTIYYQSRKDQLYQYFGFFGRLSSNKKGFILGILLALSVGPTVNTILFTILPPLINLADISKVYILLLIFSLGTVIGVMVLVGIIFGVGIDKILNKYSSKNGKWTHMTTAIVFFLSGINYMFLYWIY